MRRIVIWNVVTLDGFYDGVDPWSIDFHQSVWGEELEAFSLAQADEVGTLLFGRKTYEGMAQYWSAESGPIADFMNGVDKVVASRTLDAASWNNARLLREAGATSVQALKAEEGKDIYIFGSGELIHDLLPHALIDEVRLCLAPTALGAGKSLFPAGHPIALSLLESRSLKTGGVILRYAVK